MKRFIVCYIFLSFLALLVPREWIHACEHYHAHELHDDFDSENVEGDCFACDYDLDVVEKGAEALAFNSTTNSALIPGVLLEGPKDKDFVAFLQRGPPMI
jgi:hypothetical protein